MAWDSPGCRHWPWDAESCLQLVHAICKQCLSCRQPDGKLGSPVWQPGTMKVLQEAVFSAGQCKPVFHTELHSISSITNDKPVTLVVRHKDEAARGRVTTCYLVSCDGGGKHDLSHALSNSPDQDRAATEVEKSDMLQVQHLHRLHKVTLHCKAACVEIQGPWRHESFRCYSCK